MVIMPKGVTPPGARVNCDPKTPVICWLFQLNIKNGTYAIKMNQKTTKEP